MAYPTTPKPNNIEEMGRNYLIDRAESEDGTVYTRLRKDKLFRKWSLKYQMLDASAQSTMDSWYTGCKGGYTTDTWTHPYLGTSVTIRCTGWKYTIGAYPLRDLAVELEEA